MNRLKYILPLIVALASCSSRPDYDAQGAFEATEVTVAAEGSGKILWFDIQQGDSVVAGKVIGQIDTLQLSLQRDEVLRQCAALEQSRPDVNAQIASLTEQIAGAKVERDRVARLLSDGAATQQQLDNLDTRIASLQGQLSAQKSTIGNSTASIDQQIEALKIKAVAINDQISRCRIASPINGTVLAKIAEAGEVTAFGRPLFKVADMDNIYLRAYFTSEQLQNLQLGQQVRVVADYGANSQKDYEGRIIFIATQSEFTPKTIQTQDSRANLVYAVKIAVANDGFIKLGMTGNVYVGDSGK